MIKSDKRYLRKAICMTIIYATILWLGYNFLDINEYTLIFTVVLFTIISTVYLCFMIIIYMEAKTQRQRFKTTSLMTFEKLFYLLKQEDKKKEDGRN